MEVEPNDVVESDFEQQQQPNVVVSTASSSSPRKGPAARSAAAFQGEQKKEGLRSQGILEFLDAL